MLQGIGAGGDAVDGEAGLAQALLQVGAGFRLVFGDQQFHVLSSARRWTKCGSRSGPHAIS